MAEPIAKELRKQFEEKRAQLIKEGTEEILAIMSQRIEERAKLMFDKLDPNKALTPANTIVCRMRHDECVAANGYAVGITEILNHFREQGFRAENYNDEIVISIF